VVETNQKRQNPQQYEILPHTADAALRVFGTDEKELFVNAARGLSAILGTPQAGPRDLSEEISLTAEDEVELLVRWLNELLYLGEARNAYWHDFIIRNLSGTTLEATVVGARFSDELLKSLSVVKSATYHDLHIERKEGILQAEIVFDL